MKKISLKFFVYVASLAVAFSSCSDDDNDSPNYDLTYPESVEVGKADAYSTVKGFYLLNEGRVEANNSTLSFYDATKGDFYKNIFPFFNPSVAHGLGEIGNDIQVYKDKAYAVMNNSKEVVVIDTKTNQEIGVIAIAAPRHIAFSGNYAYITTTSNLASSEDEKCGALAKVDLSTNKVVAYLPMKYGPEGLVVRDNKVYVANSQYFNGTTYQSSYSNEVVVVNIANNAFEISSEIEVGLNLTKMVYDSTSGNIYVISNGDYGSNPAKIGVISKDDTGTVIENSPATNLVASKGILYGYTSNGYMDGDKYVTVFEYFTVNTDTNVYEKANFLDEKRSEIVYPYGISINPETSDFYITDAKDFSSPGAVFCFSKDGTYRWSAVTGINPSSIAFSSNVLTGLSTVTK